MRCGGRFRTRLISVSYLDSARAARQLDDAAALKQSLSELQEEIRLARAA